ncbi:transglycosylase family protein [Actinomyces bouchesdurhonensis]|uniref:transglycosylase family protein n=1 Tax=Actinomyces bouchesdurhonensis TaxID=1852361 RepID=UPI0028EBD9DA|nr:transglycosylase family protein [Actinomyces bouchesdurhonensis]
MSLKPSRTTVISVASAAALLVAGTAAAAVGTSYRHVTVEVDGVSRDVSGFFITAGDALNTAGVSVGSHDLVAPASDQRVTNGDTVVVRTATEYDVTVDGNRTTAWSTASSISGVLSALPAVSSSMAADRSYTRAEMPLGEGGETIHVVADGATTDVVASAAEGTTAILQKAGISAGPIDRVTLENSGGDITLRVARVVRGNITTTTEIPYDTEEREDAEAEQGTEKTVQEGVVGSQTTESYQETIDGQVTVSAVLTTTRTEPTPRIISKGTKEKKAEETKNSSDSSSSSSSSSSPAVASGDDAAIWAAIAQCESGGNPSTNTGNGYYGMYQFSLPTWQSVGGTGLPSDASAEEQTMRARMLQQRAGWGQWGCAYKLGLV